MMPPVVISKFREFVRIIGASTITLPVFASPIESVPAVMWLDNSVAESSKTPGCGMV